MPPSADNRNRNRTPPHHRNCLLPARKRHPRRDVGVTAAGFDGTLRGSRPPREASRPASWAAPHAIFLALTLAIGVGLPACRSDSGPAAAPEMGVPVPLVE